MKRNNAIVIRTVQELERIMYQVIYYPNIETLKDGVVKGDYRTFRGAMHKAIDFEFELEDEFGISVVNGIKLRLGRKNEQKEGSAGISGRNSSRKNSKKT